MMTELLQQLFNGMVIGSVYVLIALGLTVIFGIFGVAHFAHGSISMFGGYLTYVIMQHTGMGMFLSMAAAMPAGALIGIAVERLAYRPVRDAPHINAFIIALGLTMMVEGIDLLIFGADQVALRTTYNRVFTVGGLAFVEMRLYVVLTAFLLVVAMTYLLRHTMMGKAVRAVAQNRMAAILMGVDVEKVSMVVFAVSSMLGVAAGALVGSLLAIAPGVGEWLVVKGFAVLILGGLGSIPGAIIGGLVLGATETIAAGFLSSAYKDVLAFLVMIFVLLIRPEGLMGKR
jgi:branched-chain amino acid transport system permease protein